MMFISLMSFSQLSGDIKKDQRKLITETAFILEGNHNGKVVFDISVDITGKITAIKVVDDETTVKSTPAKIKAQNHVKTFVFEPGTAYPKFHQGRVVITLVKPK